jgi:hypothetical protein
MVKEKVVVDSKFPLDLFSHLLEIMKECRILNHTLKRQENPALVRAREIG